MNLKLNVLQILSVKGTSNSALAITSKSKLLPINIYYFSTIFQFIYDLASLRENV